MTNRYVEAAHGSGSGTFDDPAKPARTIGDALRAAAPGDTIVIKDAATYSEDELVVDRALTIASSYILAHPTADPASAGFTAGKQLPTIKAKGRHRVLRIVGSPGTRTSFGPVVLKGVRISGGHATHTAADPALGCGGGIAVIDADKVRIERCVIRDNQTHAARIGPWPEGDRVALRDGVVGLAGDILSPTLESAVNAMISLANKLLAFIHVTPLPVLSRATALAALSKAFDTLLAPGRPNHWLGGQAFGGGVAFVWSNGELRNCLVRGNVAQGRGAGVAVSGYGWPTISHCWIDANTSGSTGRLDGGGIGCTVSFPGRLTRNLSEIDLVRFFTAKLGSVRATIKDPLSTLTVSDLLDYAKWLASPWNPSPPVRGVKAILLDLIAQRWEPALWHLLYFVLSSALSLNKWDAWKQDEILLAQHSAIVVSHCSLTGNVADDDGGALYASVMSRMHLEHSTFVGNLARSSGGGVRLSMGSAGTLDHCELSGNTAVVDESRDPKKKLVNGGGGVSCRNVDLTLTATRIGPGSVGPAAPGRDWNVTTDHAGGGLAFQADTEGNLAGIPDLWTAIQREVFGVKQVTVRIDRASAVKGNGAGYDERRAPMAHTEKAKGGGVWFVQGEFPDAPRMDLSIEAVQTIVRGNTAQTRRYPSKAQPGLVIPAADDVCVQDLIGHREYTEGNDAPLIDASGTLRLTT